MAIVAGGVAEVNEQGRLYRFIQRNKVSAGEDAELISPGKIGRAFRVEELYLPDGTRAEATPHPSMIYWCRVPFEVREGDILRVTLTAECVEEIGESVPVLTEETDKNP